MSAAVALIRGINVGTSRKVPMARLRSIFAEAGATGVRTYIQSGNVVYEHPGGAGDKVRDDLEARLSGEFGWDVSVMLRTGTQWDEVVATNPYPDAAPTHSVVLFLQDKPPAGVFKSVDVAAFAPEEFRLIGREVYLHLPDGQARTKLPDALGRALKSPTTGRNWRTVEKLHELLHA